MDSVISSGVRPSKFPAYTSRQKKAAFFSKRKFAQAITQRSVDVGFIESDPVTAQVCQSENNVAHETPEEMDGLRSSESFLGFQPQRVGEVMKSYKRTHAPVPQGLEHLAIAIEGMVVPDALGGLNSAPLYGQAERIDAQRLSQIKIQFGIFPPVAGLSNVLSRTDAPQLLPGRPLVIGIAALHLMGRGGDAPQKIHGESPMIFYIRSLIHLFMDQERIISSDANILD